MHPFGSSLHVIQHNSQENWREILISRSRIYLTLRDRDYRSRSSSTLYSWNGLRKGLGMGLAGPISVYL